MAKDSEVEAPDEDLGEFPFLRLTLLEERERLAAKKLLGGGNIVVTHILQKKGGGVDDA